MERERYFVPAARLRVRGALPSPLAELRGVEIARPAPSGSPDLSSYDLIVVSTSGGKDSQVALDVTIAEARRAGVLDRVHVVHADLGADEWAGTTDLVIAQAEHYGVPLSICSRIGQVKTDSRGVLYAKGDTFGDLHDYVRRRKAAHVAGHQASKRDAGFSSPKREVWTWLPIHGWTTREVWATIRDSGAPYHWAYDVGMPRLSCSLCIFAPKSALTLAGHYNRKRLVEKRDLEIETGDTFKADLALGDVLSDVDAGVWPGVEDWTM